MKDKITEKIIKLINSRYKMNYKIYKEKGFINLISFYQNLLFASLEDKLIYNFDLENFKRVEYKSFDNKKLVGIFYLNKKKSKKWVVCCHGFSQSKEASFIASYYFNSLGYNIFSFDFRNHGESDDAPTTMGINEEKDLISTLDFMKVNFKIKKILLIGFSMGAHVINRFALREDFKKYKVKLAISDSTYFDVKKVIDHNIKSHAGPLIGSIFENFINKTYETYNENYNVNILEDNLENKIKECKKTIPILYLHAKNDIITNSCDSEKFYQLRKKIIKKDSINIFENGSHIKLNSANKDTYWEIIKKFVKKHF